MVVEDGREDRLIVEPSHQFHAFSSQFTTDSNTSLKYIQRRAHLGACVRIRNLMSDLPDLRVLWL